MNEFHLTSELLLQAFWGGFMCKNNCLTHCHGYFNSDEGNYGRGFIEYCVARIFGIHRVPGHEQFYIKNGVNYTMRSEYGVLNEADINTACEEMEKLYLFVQAELKESSYVKNGKVKLVRSLRPFEIEAVTPQLLSNTDTIKLPVNIITSYAHDGRLYGYGSSMSLVREVPVEQIVMFDECLFHPENVCAHYMHGGEYEVWVVEDNMFGQIELDRECFKYKELDRRINRKNWYPAPKDPDTSLYTVNSGFKRPCEWNKFTKWLIGRNCEKMKELFGFLDE